MTTSDETVRKSLTEIFQNIVTVRSLKDENWYFRWQERVNVDRKSICWGQLAIGDRQSVYLLDWRRVPAEMLKDAIS